MTETTYQAYQLADIAENAGEPIEPQPHYALWVVVALLAACLVAAALALREADKSKRKAERLAEEDAQKERKRQADEREAEERKHQADEKKKRELAGEYCRTEQAVENRKAEEAYRKVFLRYARMYQALIGLERRSETEQVSDEFFTDEVKTILNNSAVKRTLQPDGFSVKATPEIIDMDASMNACMRLDVAGLEKELEKQKRLLLHYQGMLDCKRYLDCTGRLLYALLRETDTEENPRKCRQLVSEIHAALEREGCHALFADNPTVTANEYLRIDFADDSPDATELPGLYILRNGEYLRIGACGGTRRVTG